MRNQVRVVLLASCLAVFSCTPPAQSIETGTGPTLWQGEDGTPVDAPVADLRTDANRDGVVEVSGTADETSEGEWSKAGGAIFLANLDDDTERCPKTGTDLELPNCFDAADEIVNGEQDLLDLATVKIAPWPRAPKTAKGKLEIDPIAAPRVRLFRQNMSGTAAATWVPFNAATDTFSQSELLAGVELKLEAKDIVRDPQNWSGYVTLTLTVTTGTHAGSQGESLGGWDGGVLYENLKLTDVVQLRVAPLLTYHHLSDTETAYATNVPGDPDSVDFRTDLQGGLTQAMISNALNSILISNNPNLADQWTQDFFETGFMTMPAAGGKQHPMQVAIRSANYYDYDGTKPNNPLRPAGKIVFTRLRGKNVGALQQFGTPSSSSEDTLNSFGNMETIPPYTHNGQSYPMGRHVMGNVPSYHPDTTFTKMMEAQGQQPPVNVDTSWLLVGHIDETISFIPTNSPRGWTMLINDPRMAKSMLEAQVAAGNGGIEMFKGLQTYNAQNTAFVPANRTINAVLADTNVMAESAASAAEVDAQVEIIKAATGLTEAELIRVPYLHERVQGFSLAYQPGTVNGILFNGKVFGAPDPHGPEINGRDIMKAQLEEALAPHNIQVKWIENWYLYHLNAGEVHCGSNTMRRVPSAKWWESGR